jgi:hypothetical protein
MRIEKHMPVNAEGQHVIGTDYTTFVRETWGEWLVFTCSYGYVNDGLPLPRWYYPFANDNQRQQLLFTHALLWPFMYAVAAVCSIFFSQQG